MALPIPMAPRMTLVEVLRGLEGRVRELEEGREWDRERAAGDDW